MEKIWMKEGQFVELNDEQLKELTTEELAAYTSDKNKAVLDNTLKAFEDKIIEANEQNVTKEDYEAFKETIKEQLDSLNIKQELKDEIHSKHAELIQVLKTQGVEIKSLKASRESMGDADKIAFETLSRKQQFEVLMKQGMETEEFKKWFKSDMRGSTEKMDAAKVTGLASDHTGTIFVTEPVDNVRDIPRMQPHMRDYLSVGMTDETDITFPEITNYADIYTLGAQMLAENEEITDVSFKSEEKTSKVVRMGVSMDVSKRYFRGRSQVIVDHILAQIPDALMYKEDVQILKGDGTGNNLNGIITDARKFDLAPQTYVAGNIASVASYDGGAKALITFDVPHGLLGGDNLEIANATEASYNAVHSEILIIDEYNVVINLAYVVEASTAAWTGTGTSYWYQLKEAANEFDVLSAAASILDAGLYRANIIFLNPQTVMNISTLKATDLQYIGVTRDAMGNLNVNGIPIVSLPVIDAGWFLLGDFSMKNIEIRDYTALSIQFLEDVTTKKSNSIVVLADTEFHLVKYNPKWYIYDRFSTSKAQLEATP